MMDHRNRNQHVAKDAKGRNASEQSEDEAQPAEEFRRNGQNRERCRNMQHAGEKAHCAREAVSTEPPERLLGPMGEEDHESIE